MPTMEEKRVAVLDLAEGALKGRDAVASVGGVVVRYGVLGDA